MSAQHLRPLVAFVVVAILGAVVFVNTMQARTVLEVIRTGAASVAGGNPLLHEPLFVVEPGQRLAPDEGGVGEPGGASPDRAAVTGSEGAAVNPSGDRPATAETSGQGRGRPAAPPDDDGAEEGWALGAGPEADPADAETDPRQTRAGGDDRRGHGEDRGHDRGDRDRDDRGEGRSRHHD